MISSATIKIETFLKLLLLSFPILIILGAPSLNFFSVVFSLYALFNFKTLKKFEIFDKKILIIFFSFIIFIFPFDSINFENSFLKYLSFFRFILMMIGLIIFFEKENRNNLFLFQIYKTYIVILTIIIIDTLIEYYFGSNLLGFSSPYKGRIASFTNDELIIGYIYCFITLFTLVFIYKKTNHYFFWIIACALLIISFTIGERSNFIKLTLLIITFSVAHFFYFKKFKIKNLIILFSIIIIFFISLYKFTINTPQGNKLFFIDDLIISKNDKISFNFKGRFLQSNHAAHYIAAYNVFLNHPIFGVGINNFHNEAKKKKYEDHDLEMTEVRASTHPHQVYFEIISEVGLIGLIYFILIFFYPIYTSIKSLNRSNEIIIVSHLFLHFYFIFPILPSGSFFGTNYGIPFWYNLAILFYLSRKNLKFN